jgi:hypothetical protein
MSADDLNELRRLLEARVTELRYRIDSSDSVNEVKNILTEYDIRFLDFDDRISALRSAIDRLSALESRIPNAERNANTEARINSVVTVNGQIVSEIGKLAHEISDLDTAIKHEIAELRTTIANSEAQTRALADSSTSAVSVIINEFRNRMETELGQTVTNVLQEHVRTAHVPLDGRLNSIESRLLLVKDSDGPLAEFRTEMNSLVQAMSSRSDDTLRTAVSELLKLVDAANSRLTLLEAVDLSPIRSSVADLTAVLQTHIREQQQLNTDTAAVIRSLPSNTFGERVQRLSERVNELSNTVHASAQATDSTMAASESRTANALGLQDRRIQEIVESMNQRIRDEVNRVLRLDRVTETLDRFSEYEGRVRGLLNAEAPTQSVVIEPPIDHITQSIQTNEGYENRIAALEELVQVLREQRAEGDGQSEDNDDEPTELSSSDIQDLIIELHGLIDANTRDIESLRNQQSMDSTDETESQDEPQPTNDVLGAVDVLVGYDGLQNKDDSGTITVRTKENRELLLPSSLAVRRLRVLERIEAISGRFTNLTVTNLTVDNPTTQNQTSDLRLESNDSYEIPTSFPVKNLTIVVDGWNIPSGLDTFIWRQVDGEVQIRTGQSMSEFPGTARITLFR